MSHLVDCAVRDLTFDDRDERDAIVVREGDGGGSESMDGGGGRQTKKRGGGRRVGIAPTPPAAAD